MTTINGKSRLIPHVEMTAVQLVDCSYNAMAILNLCHHAAASIQGGDSIERTVQTGDSIASALGLAMELLGPVHDALELHEGFKEQP